MRDGFGRHTPILLGDLIVRAISMDIALLPHFGDSISELFNDYQWIEVGDPVDDIVQSVADSVASWYSDMNIGQVSSFLGSLPAGWLALDGSTYSADDYPQLFAALDSQFKDIPENEFTLPDMGGLFALAGGNGFVLGDTGGAVDVSLSVAEMPAHTHDYTLPVPGVDVGGAGPPLPAIATVTPGTPTSSTGSGNAHENLPPYFALVMGIFSGKI